MTIEVVLIALLAWGALAFGAVYPWAYLPLLVAVAAVGLWSLAAATRTEPTPLALRMALLAVGIAIVVQLVPLPRPVLLRVSPAADAFVRQFDPLYSYRVANELSVSHPLTISPAKTRLGLLFFASFAILLCGLARVLDHRRVRKFAAALVVLGAVVALVGIIQKPFLDGLIYGFWTPEAGPLPFAPSGGPFGPFINRNHFAGWMLMALPLSIAHLAGLVQRSARQINGGWRDRVLWLSSSDANRVILVAFCIFLMAAALLMTLSRSGIACFAVALVLSASAMTRGIVSAKRLGMVVGFGVLVLLVLKLTDFSLLESRFDVFDRDLEMRFGAWDDAIRIFQAFSVTGTGLNTYGVATLLYQTYRTDILHFAEAHNDYLQLLAEGGLLLAVPAAIALVVFIVAVYRRLNEGIDDMPGYWLRLGAVTGLIAIGLQETIDFSLQMPANALLFSVLAAIAVTGHRFRSERHLT